MKKFPVALQLFSVRDDLAADFEGTIKKVAAMGYDGVEFAGLCGIGPESVRDICAAAGVTPISAHVAFGELIASPEETVGAYASIGCKYIAIPYLTEEYRPGNEKFGEIIEGARLIGGICRKYGITLLYHNHDFEFIKIDGEYALDILYKEVSEDLLKTELDTCWVNVGGEDPSSYIEKYSGRAPVVHLKDFVMPGKKPEKMYQLIGIDDGAQSDVKEEEAFGFRPIGYGVQNFERILEAAERAGTKWVVVEQDAPSMGKTPLECAQMSIDYVKRLMNA